MDTPLMKTDPPEQTPPGPGTYFVRTKQFRALLAHAREHFIGGRTALLVIGDHSTGAAEACRRVGQQRAKERNALFVALSTSPPLTRDSRNALLTPGLRTCQVVMRELLESWGARLAHTRLDAMTERVTRKMRVDSLEFSGRVNCFVDLRTPGELDDIVHLEFLRNRLQRQGCEMETIGLYSRLDKQQVEALANSPAAKPIAARWLSNCFRWQCMPLAELPAFLGSYDLPLKRDGLSRSQRRAPEWWRDGWRMQASVDVFTEALHATAKAAGKGRCLEVPTGILAKICEAVLVSAGAGRTPAEQIARSVETSELWLYWSMR